VIRADSDNRAYWCPVCNGTWESKSEYNHHLTPDKIWGFKCGGVTRYVEGKANRGQ